MTGTAYAKTEPDFTEGYLHLVMAPDGTLYNPNTEPEASSEASSDMVAEQLLEAIRSLEERMSLRIDSLAAQDLGAERPAPAPTVAENAGGREPALPSPDQKIAAAEAAQPLKADKEPESAPAQAQASKRSSAAPYVVVSAILIAVGIGSIALAGLYIAGVI